jgi:pimeloyl-ACP methyl ester carboxylesterase
MRAVDHVRSFDGTPIAFAVEGQGPAVLLLHGFAADHRVNWVAPGVVAALVAAGRRVIATDARGHGASGKPHEPAAYEGGAMLRDARAVLDHLGVGDVDVVGYSMGAMVAVRLAPDEPRMRALVLGGIGGDATPRRGAGTRRPLADALLTEDPAAIRDPTAKAFRRFAERTKADRQALAALERSAALRGPVHFDAVKVPTLVLVGEADALVGPPEDLVARLPDAWLERVPGDHLSAVAHPGFARAIVRFLEEKSPS